MNLDSWTPRDIARRVGWLAGLTVSSFTCAALYFDGSLSAPAALALYVALTSGVAFVVYHLMRLRYGARFHGPLEGRPFKDVLEPPPGYDRRE